MKYLTSELERKVRLIFGFWLAFVVVYVFMDIMTNGWTLLRFLVLGTFGYLANKQITKNSDKMGFGDIVVWAVMSLIVLLVILFVIAIILDLLGDFIEIL